MDLPAVIGLLGTGTVGQMAKDDFSKRYANGTPIAFTNFSTRCSRDMTPWL